MWSAATADGRDPDPEVRVPRAPIRSVPPVRRAPSGHRAPLSSVRSRLSRTTLVVGLLAATLVVTPLVAAAAVRARGDSSLPAGTLRTHHRDAALAGAFADATSARHAHAIRVVLAVAEQRRAEAARQARDAARRAREALWDRMAQCETGGNWHLHGRYAGGLGIYVGTWRTVGGDEFAPTPDGATREQQIAVAERIRARFGIHAWGCARRLGL